MHTSKIRRMMIAGALALAPRLSGQEPPLNHMPADRANREFTEETLSGRPVTVFERMERTLRSAPSREPERPSVGTTSVDELRHPLSGKGRRLIESGQRYAKAGDHDRAIVEFRKALREPPSAPYACALLGIEYLKTRDFPAAVASLTEAIQYMPRLSANHSNLGYAFFLMGKRDSAERELREAVKLDNVAPQPRYLLGLLLLDQRSEDAGRYLSLAQRILGKARLALAIFHFRHGDAVAAAQDLREFLGSQWPEEAAGALQWARAAAQMERPSILFGFPAEAHQP